MNYSLMQKIKRTTFTGLVALTLTSGCKQQYGLVGEKEYTSPRGSVQLSTDENPKRHKLKRVTNDDSKYELESIVINGKRYYTIKNDYKKEDEADVILIRYEDHQLIRNTEEKKASLHSETLYIPALTRGHRGSFATEGKYGIKAQIKKYDISNIDSEIIRENQNDVMFNIKSIYLPSTKKEWFTPYVEDDKMGDKKALPFYMIPVEKTKQITNVNGKITLESSEGIFRPIEITLEDYKKRQKERAEEEKKKAEADAALQTLQAEKTGQFTPSPDSALPSPAVIPAPTPTTPIPTPSTPQTTPPAPTTPTPTPSQKP